MRILNALVLLVIGSGWLVSLRCQQNTTSEPLFLVRADSALTRLVRMQKEIKDIHPYLSIFHPIALVEKDELYVFDMDSSAGQYRLRRKDPVPFPMSKGIRASFPLSSYGNKPTCVVSLEAFDEPKGYATVFHEFVHCAQFLTVEPELKQQLEVARQAALAKAYSWELDHSFPYQDSVFVEDYSSFLAALKDGDQKKIEASTRALRVHLPKVDYEYMVWEEWKEGFARFIENKIRARLGVQPNEGGADRPFNRVTFYFGGEAFVRYLVWHDQDLLTDTQKLFEKMLKE